MGVITYPCCFQLLPPAEAPVARLTQNEGYAEGVFEVYYDGWIQFDAKYWDENAAVVACRTLGYK